MTARKDQASAPDRERNAAHDRSAAGPWRPPTRRAFVAMIGGAAAAFAARDRVIDGLASPAPGSPAATASDDPPRPRRTGGTRWIGHC